ncbi:TolC family protein [Spirosoma endbachense]|uniref:TolC family protein n=1 Tax=Spirosoma endbachense TaxID=2666025 RepID=A0A6P1VM20_9BACT|nr:TolC family protein [Spirosoma endbachense]QHV94113.1 TolC family protein [Spirosoma endbachense]
MQVAWKQVGAVVALLFTTSLSGTYAQSTPTTASTGDVTAALAAGAPARLNLLQCIEIAQQNNITVRQGQLTVANNDLLLHQSRLNLLPTTNFQANQGLNGGRSINPQSNGFVQQSIVSGSYQLNGAVTLYNGLVLRNTIKQNDLILQASQHELKATQNNISLTVAQNYLNVLTGTEQLSIAQRQSEVTRAQLDRTQRLVNAGSAPEANLFELRATLASNEVDIVTAQNTLDLAKVALLQAMNVPINQAFEVEPINVPDPGLDPYTATVQQLFDIAATNLPEVKGADMRVKSAALGVQVAKGALYPVLSLNGNLSSIYSSAANKQSIATGTTSQQITGFFMDANGAQQPVYSTVPNFNVSDVTYIDQLQNNFNRSASLFLRVPIFQGNLSRNRITTAKIQQQNAELTAQNTRLTLRQQIETAYTGMRAAANKFRATQVQVSSLEKAFQVAESRLNAGAINATDYSIAKTNLDRARASLVQAKYDYVFRTKILDYYQNKPLAFN